MAERRGHQGERTTLIQIVDAVQSMCESISHSAVQTNRQTSSRLCRCSRDGFTARPFDALHADRELQCRSMWSRSKLSIAMRATRQSALCSTRRIGFDVACVPQRFMSSAERARTQTQKTRSCAAVATRTTVRANIRNDDRTSPPG
jgi:hypothetical protein